MTERRAVARVTPREPVQARLKTSLPARILDISSHGAQLEVTNCLKPNVVCEIRLLLDDGEVTVKATVRRCRAWGFGVDERDQRVLLYRAGVEFSQVAPDVIARLRREFALPESGEFPRVEPEKPAAKPAARTETPAPPPVSAARAEVSGPRSKPGTARQAEEVPRQREGGKPAGKPPAAPRRNGPVKIRISSEHVRKILDDDKKG